MLQKLLGGLGLIRSLPPSQPGDEGPDTDGQASIAFSPGRKIAPSIDDEDGTQDDRVARVTDRDLVWPGKVEQIQIGNPEQIAYRYDLTVTDLSAAYYVRRPVVGGQAQAEGGVLLEPGEEASFEVVFVAPLPSEKMRTRAFSFVLTRFDPRRSADPGEIVQDLLLRWVALPTESDLKLSATPRQVTIRPWRRAAFFQVQLQNKSYLPPGIEMQIVRAPTKEALVKEPEVVGSLSQSLAARTSGIWHCLLPPFAAGGSYYATATGKARVGDTVEQVLAPPAPIHVRYTPWLRMGRDWAFLLGVLLLLVWLSWGMPVQKRPLVHLTVDFADLDKGQMPEDGRLRDLTATLILLDKRENEEEGQPHILGVVRGSDIEFTGPARWYGIRWAFGDHLGWNGFSREQQLYRIKIAPVDGKESAFRRYDFPAASPEDSRQAMTYRVSDATSVFGDWTTQAALIVPRINGAMVQLNLGDLGGLRKKDLRQLTVNYTLGGQSQPPHVYPILRDPQGRLRPITLDLTDQVVPGSPMDFSVDAVALGVVHSNPVDYLQIRRQPKPFQVTLTFPQTIPLTPEQIAAEKAKEKAAEQAAKEKAAAQAAKAAKEKADALPGHGAKSAGGGAKPPSPKPPGPKPPSPKPPEPKPHVVKPPRPGPIGPKPPVLATSALPDYLLADADTEKVQRALAATDQQIAGDPHNPLTLAVKGYLLYQLGTMQHEAEGAHYFTSASSLLKSLPRSPASVSAGTRVASLALLARGSSYERRNDPEKARFFYEAATKHDPAAAAYAHYRLAQFYSNQPNPSSTDIRQELGLAKNTDPDIASLPGYAALAHKWQMDL